MFATTRNGFDIAEADFKLRGPGQFFGVRSNQGMPELKIADLLKGEAILADARRDAVRGWCAAMRARCSRNMRRWLESVRS